MSDKYKTSNDKIQAALATMNVEQLLSLYEAGDQKAAREIFKSFNGPEAAAAWSRLMDKIGDESNESKMKRVIWFHSTVSDIVLQSVRPLFDFDE